MDYTRRMSSGFGPTNFNPYLNAETLLKFTDLTPSVQKHLGKVYVTLAAALLVSALGVVTTFVLPMPSLLSMVGFMGCLFWLLSTPAYPQNLNKRYALLAGTAFFQGTSVGPLVGAALQIHPAIVLTAFMATSAVFACFSGAALLSRRRSYLYLGGLLSSAVSGMMMLRLGSWLFGAGRGLAFQAELYLGLLVFMGYILFDTQVIVEKASRGNTDHIKAALDLFVDFVAVFVRLLIILLRNQERRSRKSDGRKRR